MTESPTANPQGLPVAMIVGATSKWRADGHNTIFAHGAAIDDASLPPATRWGLGGALALKFAGQGYFVVLTTRRRANAEQLAQGIAEAGGQSVIVELDVTDEDSVAAAFAETRAMAGEPDSLIYNAGYFFGRDLPPELELFETLPIEIYDQAQLVAGRGPVLVAKQVLPAMRKRGSGSIFFSNNPSCLRGRRRRTGESLYYPRVLQRTLAQVLTDDYTRFGVHVANVIVSGLIDSPGTHALDRAEAHPEVVMDPARIADAFYYLHEQDRSCWTHELEITPFGLTG